MTSACPVCSPPLRDAFGAVVAARKEAVLKAEHVSLPALARLLEEYGLPSSSVQLHTHLGDLHDEDHCGDCPCFTNYRVTDLAPLRAVLGPCS